MDGSFYVHKNREKKPKGMKRWKKRERIILMRFRK